MTSLGALPPDGSELQIGDRADKPCVMAASQVFMPHMRARGAQAEHFVDELPLIADDGRNDFMERARQKASRARVLITKFWERL